jgi:hypothetical protein
VGRSGTVKDTSTTGNIRRAKKREARCSLPGKFVFLPDADFSRDTELFAEASLLESGANDRRLAFLRDGAAPAVGQKATNGLQ